MPWMADDLAPWARVGDLLDRAAGSPRRARRARSATLPPLCVADVAARPPARCWPCDRRGGAVGEGTAHLELGRHLRVEQPAHQLGQGAVRRREREPLVGVLGGLGAGEADDVVQGRGVALDVSGRTRPRRASCARCAAFFTVSVCAPEVVPVSPITVRLTPLCGAVDTKCTPLVPTALMAALVLGLRALARARRRRGGAAHRAAVRRPARRGRASPRPAAAADETDGAWCMHAFTLLVGRPSRGCGRSSPVGTRPLSHGRAAPGSGPTPGRA